MRHDRLPNDPRNSSTQDLPGRSTRTFFFFFQKDTTDHPVFYYYYYWLIRCLIYFRTALRTSCQHCTRSLPGGKRSDTIPAFYKILKDQVREMGQVRASTIKAGDASFADALVKRKSSKNVLSFQSGHFGPIIHLQDANYEVLKVRKCEDYKQNSNLNRKFLRTSNRQ